MAVDQQIDEYTFAAASLDLNNLENITSLPDEDPETLALLSQNLATPHVIEQTLEHDSNADGFLNAFNPDLTILAQTRWSHQSLECAQSVRLQDRQQNDSPTEMISEPQQLAQKIMTLSNFTAQIKDLAQALIVASVGKKLPPGQKAPKH
ncbi:hypothetical protein AAF712_012193 [Marasmius tenuissimus]|uniref:Uncharacterized protein n=1 Tax=Marasmius tenuissimus TaxID=585030 RepID=A0ABR2ZJT2_9AGAR